MVVRVEEDLKNLDPAYRTGPIDVNVILAVGQGLVKFKPGTTEWENDAAADIKQVDDKLIEFTLKEGLKFTGGYGELTAEDVKFSFERFIKPGADGAKVDYADDWAALDSVEVTGPLTGKIHLKNPSPAVWLIALADGSGVIISKKAFEALGDKFKTTPIGSGPYILKEWVPRDHFTLVVNPDYLGEKPAFAEIVGKPIADDKTAQLALAGRRDRLRRASTRRSPRKSRAAPGIKVQKLSAIDYVWIGPNIEKKPFDDVRVRQAIRKAIDVPAIIAAAYNGAVEPAYALEAPGILGYWKDAPTERARRRRRQDAARGGRAGRRLLDPADRAQQGRRAGDRGGRAGQPRRDRHRRADRRARRGRLLGLWRERRQQGSRAGAGRISRQVRSGLPDAMVHRRPDRHLELAALEQQGVRRAASSRAASRPIAKKREQIYIDAQKLMDEFRRLLVDHPQRLHLRLQGHAGAGHPAQRQPVAVRLVQAGLNDPLRRTTTGRRPASSRASCCCDDARPRTQP